MVSAMTDALERGTKGESAIVKMREMMKSVNAALGLTVIAGIPSERSGGAISETEPLRTEDVKHINPPPVQ